MMQLIFKWFRGKKCTHRQGEIEVREMIEWERVSMWPNVKNW